MSCSKDKVTDIFNQIKILLENMKNIHEQELINYIKNNHNGFTYNIVNNGRIDIQGAPYHTAKIFEALQQAEIHTKNLLEKL